MGVPAFVRIKPGDSVTFVAADQGHMAGSIPGMMPEGAKPFQGQFGKSAADAIEGGSCKVGAAMIRLGQ